MNNRKNILLAILFVFALSSTAQKSLPVDIVKTTYGKLKIHLVDHAFIYFKFDDEIIYIDPVPGVIKIEELPKADLIMITHSHNDHFDKTTIEKLSKPSTLLIYPRSCSKTIPGGKVMRNDDQYKYKKIFIKALPAYNLINKKDDGTPYHPKGFGNGYLIRFDNKLVYIAGDTEYIPEMKWFHKPDIAFLPIMEPYTMDVEMFAKTVKTLQPEIVYPYHNETLPLIELQKAIINEDAIIRYF